MQFINTHHGDNPAKKRWKDAERDGDKLQRSPRTGCAGELQQKEISQDIQFKNKWKWTVQYVNDHWLNQKPINCICMYFVYTFYTSTKSWRGYIFTSVCLCVCLSVCLSEVFLLTKFQPNEWTALDAVFAKWLLTALARTLLKLVTLGQRSEIIPILSS